MIPAVLAVLVHLLSANFSSAQQPDPPLVSIRLSNESLEQAFEKISRTTPFRVMYNNEQLEKAQKVTVSLERVPIPTVMNTLLQGQPFSYVIEDNNIIIVPRKNSGSKKTIPSLPDAISGPIAGQVTDADGRPLSGASITIKGSNKTVITDALGKFSIEADPGSVLIISYVGYASQQVVLKDQQSLTIHLAQEISGLDEITVMSTGYQDIPKERATGSFVKVDNELLNRSVSTNILDRLYNVTSGLNYTPQNAISTTKSTINIRGISTINADMKPLIVVDGFPYDEGILANGTISNINPNDIESITVLRDAAAASIWGARSGNGVIVITTKKGKYNQKNSIQFNSNITISEKPNLNYLPIISPKEYLDLEKKLFNEGFYQGTEDAAMGGAPIPLSPGVELLIAKRDGTLPASEIEAMLAKLERHRLIDDIDKYLFRPGIFQQYALNISGGTEKLNYYAAIGADRITQNNGSESLRWNLRLDNTFRLLKNLDFNHYIVYTQSNSTNSGIDISNHMPTGSSLFPIAPYTMLADQYNNPVAIPRDYRTTYVDTLSHTSLADWHYRPLEEARVNSNGSKLYSARMGGSFNYSLKNGLVFRIAGQYEKSLTVGYAHQTQQSYYTRNMINQFTNLNSPTIPHPIPKGGIMDLSNIELTSWNIRGQIGYNRVWKNHDLNTLAGWEASEFENDIQQNRYYGYNEESRLFATNIDYNGDYLINPWQYTSKIPNPNSYNGTLRRLISYYFNSSYTFQKNYTISASSRIDGANLFGVAANDKITPLWSAGLSWKISNEKFYRVGWLPYLKIRVSTGYNGNMKNNATTFTTIMYFSSDLITGIPVASIQTPPNRGLTWERVRIINTGIDFDIANKIKGSIEYYKKKGSDLISSISTEPTTGVSSFVGNNASISGEGVDMILTTTNRVAKINWSVNMLLSYNTDKVTKYLFEPTVNGLVVPTGLNSPYVGKPLYSVFSYRWAGLDPTNGDPRGYVKEAEASYNEVRSGNNTQPEDLVYHGSVSPRFFGSLRNDLQWKNLSFSLNITYKLKYFFRRTSINYSNLFNNWSGHSDYSNRWQNPGDELSTTVPSTPAVADYNRDFFYANSEILVENGSYIRLQDIRISYNFVKNSPKHSLFKEAQLYMYFNNLGILWRTNKQGIDPDYGDFAIPPSRSISIGVTARF